MQEAVCTGLVDLGYSIVTCPIQKEDMLKADLVLLTNALMGAVPAISLDGRLLNVVPSLVASINKGALNIRVIEDDR